MNRSFGATNSVAKLLCLLDTGGKSLPAIVTVQRRKAVEEEAHGSGENPLDLLDAVTSLDELPKGAQHWQTSTNGSLVEDIAALGVAPVRSGRVDIPPQANVARETLFVRSHDVDSVGEEKRVRRSQGLVGSVVDEDYGTRGRFEEFKRLSGVRERGGVGRGKLLGPLAEVQR